MIKILDSSPIVIGVGQALYNWDGESNEEAPSPMSLCTEAARRALTDTESSKIGQLVDTVAVIKTMQDSVPSLQTPFGRCENPPRTIARDLGFNPKHAFYSQAGGEQPQALVNEFAEQLYKGEIKAALICGAEATATVKTALKKRIKLDWSDSAEGEMEDRGFGLMTLSNHEMKNGLGFPTQTYPIFEQAIRRRLGLGRDEYRELISELWAGFSKIAAQNPNAQFPTERSAEFLATLSKENFPISEPHLKWHVAQESVNQGAALILTTVGNARAAGVPENKWVYLHGYAKAYDRMPTERPDLSRSHAMEVVLKQTLAKSNMSANEIDHFDIYSCFPCVVQIAAEALGIDWRKKGLTVTGGLPFFGGPGNNYSTHAIASMVEILRENPDNTGLILANGGFMSKFTAGIYSAKPMENWAPVSSEAIQKEVDDGPEVSLFSGDTEGEIESYTIVHGRHGPERGTVIVNTPEGRVLAQVHKESHETLVAMVEGSDPLGQQVTIHHENGRNFLKEMEIAR